MSEAADLVGREVELYQQVSEVWQADHERALACYSFQDLLAKGIAALESIHRIDESFRRDVLGGQREFDASFSDRIKHLYAEWARPSQFVLAKLSAFERAGLKVDFSEAFRSCTQEVQGILADPASFFADDALVALRDEAIDASAQGNVSDCSL